MQSEAAKTKAAYLEVVLEGLFCFSFSDHISAAIEGSKSSSTVSVQVSLTGTSQRSWLCKDHNNRLITTSPKHYRVPSICREELIPQPNVGLALLSSIKL